MSFDPKQIDEFRIVLDAVGQKHLRQAGPMVPAAWSITPEREQQLNLLGKPIPSPVEGYLLLDTGAAHISIDTDVAGELGITPMGNKREVHGFGGGGEVDHYLAALILPVTPLKGGKPLGGTFGFRSPVEAWASKDIRSNHLNWGYTLPNGNPLNVIGILGRIILQFTRFSYNGLVGALEIYIDKSIMSPRRD